MLPSWTGAAATFTVCSEKPVSIGEYVSLQICSRYEPGGTSWIITIPVDDETAKYGVLSARTTAPISGWMLQKMYETPSRSKLTDRVVPDSYSPRSKRLPLNSENTL